MNILPERQNRKLKCGRISDIFQKEQGSHCSCPASSKGPGPGNSHRDIMWPHTRWGVIGHHQGFDFCSEWNGRKLEADKWKDHTYI